ncbi:hypothetical protein [Oceanobacillus arenosus]|uniref:hypothetical protein n=1 Tax=Oceanobacillus arenosus TaxID=1229153 RepID=UPI00147422AB|nr:hypothetical protein [Oceanobacillus arenosus]
MKTTDAHAEYKKAYVIEQLEELRCYDNDGLEYKELVRKLAVARALNVEVGNPESSWF